jgi:hypothetical protein
LSLPAYDFCRSMRGNRGHTIYGLSRSLMIALTRLPDTFEGLVHEDQWVRGRLRNAGIEHTNLGRVGPVFCAIYNQGTIPYDLPEYNEPRFDNRVLAAWSTSHLRAPGDLFTPQNQDSFAIESCRRIIASQGQSNPSFPSVTPRSFYPEISFTHCPSANLIAATCSSITRPILVSTFRWM